MIFKLIHYYCNRAKISLNFSTRTSILEHNRNALSNKRVVDIIRFENLPNISDGWLTAIKLNNPRIFIDIKKKLSDSGYLLK